MSLRKAMHRLTQQKPGTMILLLFLTTQILLPAFCCCGISSVFGTDHSLEQTSGSCPSCASHQSLDSLNYLVSGTDGSHECPCKARVVKQLIFTTKATVQADLPLNLDMPLHDIAVLDIVADVESVNRVLSGPGFSLRKQSQSSQSLTCCWLC